MTEETRLSRIRKDSHPETGPPSDGKIYSRPTITQGFHGKGIPRPIEGIDWKEVPGGWVHEQAGIYAQEWDGQPAPDPEPSFFDEVWDEMQKDEPDGEVLDVDFTVNE
jgi:hypothetical protein